MRSWSWPAPAAGLFYWYYEKDARVEMETRTKQLETLRADIAKGRGTADKLPQFRAQVGDLESRLVNLREVLPEEKDAADLLRRMQTVAVQSNLKIKGFKPAPVVMKQLHAEWPIALELDGTYHNLAIFLDRVGQVHPHRQHHRPAGARQGQARAELDHHRHLRGDDLRAARQTRAGQSRMTRQRTRMHLHRRRRDLRVALLILGLSVDAVVGRSAGRRRTRRRCAPAAESPRPRCRPRPPNERLPIPTPTSRRGAATPSSICWASQKCRCKPASPRHIDGAAGLPVSETTVRGVMKSGGALIALVQGVDKRTFVVHQGDKLLDGTIKAVVPEGLVIVQPVNDPLSLVKQREVRKLLRSVEDGKQ